MESKTFKNVNLTVFVGIYNGEQYLESLLQQIQSQDFKNYNLLIVDNASTDNSYEIIKTWSSKIRARNIKVKRNKVNLGGQGNWNWNLRYVQTPWITMIHQDDFYKPNHLSELNKLIDSAGKDVIGVSTTMGSMSHEGKKLNSIPRSSWFYQNLDAPEQFIQNIKSQSVPFPSTAFLLSVFKNINMPIHSPTFSDTEQTLKMLAYGRFKISGSETMLYRENHQSESHTLNMEEKLLGASIALNRVFNSTEFSILLNQISNSQRNRFSKETIKALKHRLPSGILLDQLRITALEAMINKWGYTQESTNKLLYSEYRKFASPLTLNIISSIGEINIKQESHHFIEVKKRRGIINSSWERYFKMDLKGFAKFHKPVVIFIYKIIFIIKPNHRWKIKK